MQVRSLLLQLLLSLTMSQVTSGFSISNIPAGSKVAQAKTTTAMRSASLDENDVRPKWIDLPSPPKARNVIEESAGIEIAIGRVAMVGFVGLFAKEVISGESFGQQIVDAVMVASGNH
ncbi:unnamed protein product [Cylindrotheca closterium]|uniref:Uncharacterized protein n=1 Tax=Cylindrotheca closterium TaxID=2856 RepID=A0AAD2GAF4_9STRA|nr:unnamed protein product [Cylindrotheca closterium]